MSLRKDLGNADNVLNLLKDIPLTGRIISVLPNIPVAVGITSDNKVETAPILEKTSLKSVLFAITASGWKHKIVAWTGQVFPAKSDAFQQLLKRADNRHGIEDITQQLHETSLDDDNQSERPPHYLKESPEFSTSDAEIVVDADIADQLRSFLDVQFAEDIHPVWYGRSREDNVGRKVPAEDSTLLRDTTTEMPHQILHNVQSTDQDKSFAKGDYGCYKELTERVASEILRIYQPGDIIWIHTNQQMLLPEALRRRLPYALIIYAQNEPWVSREILAQSHGHHTLMGSLLCANTIVVPTDADEREIDAYYNGQAYFKGQPSPTFRYTNMHPHHWNDLQKVPIGLDPPELEGAIRSKEITTLVRELNSVCLNKKLIVTRARVDQFQGILVVLDAFRHLLKTSSEWLGKVFLFIIITPNCLPGYTYTDSQVTADEVFRQVEDTNASYGSASYTPVICPGSNGGYRPREEYLALLRAADVGIAVNNQAFANGMTREFVIAQDGLFAPLLIATFSPELSAKADPYHPQGRIMYGKCITGEDSGEEVSLAHALSMPENERREQHRYLFRHLTEYSAQELAANAILYMGKRQLERGYRKTLPLPNNSMIKAYQSAQKRLLIFDYDGTLTPIVNNPDNAVPSRGLLEDLEDVVRVEGNTVYIVSGRSREFLQKHFLENEKYENLKNIGLSAEHGCYFKEAGDITGTWLNHANDQDLSWRTTVESFLTGLEQVYPGSQIERKEVAVVWHYRNAANQEICLEKAKQIKALLEAEEFKDLGMAVMLGKANLEVRPGQVSKGTVVNKLLDPFIEGDSKDRFVFCAGDDTTDEDMFRAILASKDCPLHCFTCFVGSEDHTTIAQYQVDGPEVVVETIQNLAKTCKDHHDPKDVPHPQGVEDKLEVQTETQGL